jgi:hypothetical protein
MVPERFRQLSLNRHGIRWLLTIRRAQLEPHFPLPSDLSHRWDGNRRHVTHFPVDHPHTPEIRPMAEPLQLPLFPDQTALTRVRPQCNKWWRYYRLAVWPDCSAALRRSEARQGGRLQAGKCGQSRILLRAEPKAAASERQATRISMQAGACKSGRSWVMVTLFRYHLTRLCRMFAARPRGGSWRFLGILGRAVGARGGCSPLRNV